MSTVDKKTKQTALDIEALKGIAIAAAETVYHYKLVARAIGRDEDTILSWRKSDKEFSDNLEQGRHRFIEKNVKLARPEFLLERLEPEIFKERTEQENNLRGELDVNLNQKTDEELDKIIDDYRQADRS